MKIKGWGCVGTHGKLYYCEISQDLQKQGRFEIYKTYSDARNNAIGENFVREIRIEVLPPKKK